MTRSIDRRSLHVILADWRDAERQLSIVTSASARAQLEREISRLRDEYRNAHRFGPAATNERTDRTADAPPVHR